MRRSATLLIGLLLTACGNGPEPLQPPAGEEADPLPTDPRTPQSDGGDEPLPADEWTSLPDAPTAASEVAAAAFGGQLWVVGGLTDDGNATRTVQVFDPAFETWEQGPDLPQGLHHAALVSTGESLYVVGGYVGSGFDMPTGAVRRLDTESGAWQTETPLPSPRGAGAAAWDGERIVYGGGVGTAGLLGDVVAFDGEEWTRIGMLAEPREHLAAASDGAGRVWFLAGRTGGLDTNLGTVDLVDGDEVTAIGEVPTPRGGVAAFWSPLTGACVVGGEEPDGTFADVECIDADGQTETLPSLRQARHGVGAAVADGMAYVLLGGPEPGLSTSATTEALRLEDS